MQTILFDSYRNFQKSNKDSIIKAVFKLPLVVKLIFAGLGICFLYNLGAIFIIPIRKAYIFCLVIEIALSIVLYIYTENFQVKNSDLRFSVYQAYCANIKNWLEQIGIVVTKENLSELISRIDKDIEAFDAKRSRKRERIEKWVQILIIPILLAVFSAVIKEQSDLSILLSYATTLLVGYGSLSLVFIGCYNAFDFFEKRKLEQLRSLSSDLQGVLDCQFDNKLFVKE